MATSVSLPPGFKLDEAPGLPPGFTLDAAANGRERPPVDAKVDSRAAPTYSALIPNAGNKALAGTADLLLNAPTNLWNLGKAGYGAAATALGRPDLAPEMTQTPDLARRGMTALGMIRPEAEPVGAAQRLVDAGVQGATGMLMNPSSGVRQAAALATTGAGAGVAAQGTKEVTGSDTAAQAVGVLAPLGINMAANQARTIAAQQAAAQSRNAPKDTALRAGIQAGYQVPPSMVRPTLGNRIVESVAGKAATQQAASVNNQEVTNALTRRAVGLPADAPLTPEAMQAIRRNAYQTGYAPLTNAGPLSTGRLYRQDLDDIVANYEGAARSFPGAVRGEVRAMVDGLRVRRLDSGDGIRMAQILRDDAGKAFASGDAALGRANRAAADAIEAQIERGAQVPPQVMDNFRDARRLMARTHTVEEAIPVGSGDVSARKLAAALQKGAPLDGELRTVAEFANNYPKAVQPPQMVGSPGVSKLGVVGSAAAGGAGALFGGPVGAGIAAGASLAAPRVAEAMLLRSGKQKSLVPQYGTSPIDRMLFAPIPQLSTGAVIPPALLAEELRKGR